MKIKETILGIGIAIIFVLFVVFGIKAFYKEPKYEEFCKRGIFIDSVSAGNYYTEPYPARFKELNPDLCSKANLAYEKFRKACAEKNTDVVYEFDANGCRAGKECAQCNNNFTTALGIYNRNVFIIAGIVGIIVIIIGAILHLTSVSSGLFGGGILTLIFGTMNYWSELADWSRFIILGIALGVLIYIGYKGFSMFGFGKKK